MKLKKIASLALAGVLAVSMLTACDTTSNEQPNVPNQPETPVASSASTTLYNELSADTRLSITSASANSTLESALSKTTATYWNSNHFDYWFEKTELNDSTPYVDQFSNGIPMLEEVAYALKAKTVFDGAYENTKGGVTVVKVYIAGGHSEDGSLAWVANAVDQDVAGKLPANGEKDGVKYEYDYTISASVVDMDRNWVGDVTQNMKFVAVAVTQTATEV